MRDALALEVGRRGSGVIDEILVGGVGDRLCRDGVAGVVQHDSADIDAELERVAADHLGHVVDERECGADLGIERVATESVKAERAGRDRGSTVGPVVVVDVIPTAITSPQAITCLISSCETFRNPIRCMAWVVMR